MKARHVLARGARQRRTPALITAWLCAVALFGGVSGAAPAAAADTVTARSLLSLLHVAAERGDASYDREKFRHWVDADGDGCDTREEVLREESRVTASTGDGCAVTGGKWYSYYDGVTWTNSSDVDIDHVVALKEAWVSGARNWTGGQRRRFANDLRFAVSLQAVTDNVNASKGDRDPAEWLPGRARCKYATRWVKVKYRWRLRVSGAEHRALSDILSGSCGARNVSVPPRAIKA